MNQESENTQEKDSLLNDIIRASRENIPHADTSIESDIATWSSQATASSTQDTWDISWGWGQKWPRKREPLPPWTILKAIGSLFFTWLIFFASFLAYIVFNPWEAQFFITMFGIDTKDIATLLRKFINGSFGIILAIVSIVWFIALFRAIYTPKEQKRKKILGWITAGLIGVLLFSVLTFWIFLFKKIWEIVWDGGVITIYDNTLYSNQTARSVSQIRNTRNMIGPITLRYDIRGNARSFEINRNAKIERFEINFDGANCADGRSIVTGSNPREEQWIVCTFAQIKNYNIRWTYFSRNIDGEVVEVPMDIWAVEVRGILDIREQKNSLWKDIITLDANTLRLLWDIRWVYEKTGEEVKSPTITLEPSETPVFLWLKVFGNTLDRIFLIQKRWIIWQGWGIEALASPVDSREYALSLTGITVDTTSILSVEWTVNDGVLICKDARSVCQHTFGTYGIQKVKAKINFADRTSQEIVKDLNVEKPLLLVRNVVVTNTDGRILNPPSTYDPVLKSYIIDSVIPPSKLIFDARDIVAENAWYELTQARWSMTDGRNTIEKIWERIEFDISNTYRYTIVGTYTFEKRIAGDIVEVRQANNIVTVDVELKTLIPRLKIIQRSDYVPAMITVDASESWSEDNEIVKFIYNFWEGRPDAVWDAIQNYTYTTPWEKEITLTIIDKFWEKAEIKRAVVLKESPRILEFMPSMATWIVWVPVDFSITEASWQVESYTWLFGNNTPLQRGSLVTHIFREPGTYTITLTATFADGTQRQSSRTYTVQPWE